MNTRFAECTEDAKLEEVFELIQRCEHGLVVVVDSLAHKVPIGVVTERSICEQVITRGRNPRNLSAGSVMDSSIKKVGETDLVESIQARQEDVAAVIVVDDSRRVRGIVAKETVKRFAPVPKVIYRPEPLVRTVAAAPPTSQRISEIPAFGWMS
ncbi:MAG: CBS domain-containing protein [Acidobacteriota bacterium]